LSNAATIPRTVIVPTTPVRGWRSVFVDAVTVGGASLVAQGVGVVTALLLRVLLDPALMGLWQVVKLVLNNANYASLGVGKAACRELTVAVGRQDETSARGDLNLAFTFNTLCSLLLAGLLVVASLTVPFWTAEPMRNLWRFGLLAAAAMVVIQRYVTFRVSILRARQQFAPTARLTVLESLLTLVVCALATWLFGWYGLLGGTLLVMGATWYFLEVVGSDQLHLAFDWPRLRQLLAIGVPLVMAAMAATLFRSLDKLMILAYLGDREIQLGYYSTAWMVAGQMLISVHMLSIVMAPRYGELFGKTSSHVAVARLAARTSELQASALGLSGGLALGVASPLLARLLPDYREGLLVFSWLIPGVVAWGLSLPASQYLKSVGQQRRVVGVLLAALVLAGVLNHFALSRGWALRGIAAATSLAYLFYAVSLIGLSLWPRMRLRERCRYAGVVASSTIFPLAIVGAISGFGLSDSNHMFWQITQCVFGLVAWAAALCWIGWHWLGWSAAWRHAEPHA
jgi:O-antigen/teichoic acid export membrane protein